MVTNIADLAFGLKLLKQVQGDASISPLNIRMAFRMLYEGARKNTAKELAEVFGFSLDKLAEAEYAARMLQDLNKKHDCELSAANGVWFDNTLEVKPEYEQVLGTSYGSKPHIVSFRTNPDGERANINKWVSEQTKAKIPQLFGPGTIHPLTALVLASALYMKAQWQKKFDVAATVEAQFGDGKAHMMRRGINAKAGRGSEKPKLQYAEFDGAQMAIIPYKEPSIVNISILPPKGTSVADLESYILENGVPHTRSAKFARLEIPRHELKGDYNLNPMLQALGLSDAFDIRKANFTGISDEPLAVGVAVHKTYFKTNEEGSEGAAATGVAMYRLMAAVPEPEVEFVADRPYLEIIKHSSGILFINRVVTP